MNAKEFNIKLIDYLDNNVNSRMYINYLLCLKDIKRAFETKKKIIIDFQDIIFISRSAFHELISFVNKHNNTVIFINMNENIDELFNLIHKAKTHPVKKFPNTFVRKEVRTSEDLESILSRI